MANVFSQWKRSIPVLGLGFGLRRELADETFEYADLIDWLEFVPENHMNLGGNSKALLNAAAEKFPLISHGVNLSIGSTDELNWDYLRALKNLLDELNCPWWSDHLCFTSIDGVYMHDLLPLPFSSEAVKHVSSRIKQVQEYMQRPFIIENISFYMHLPGSEMNEAQFLSEVLEEADCGLLLDVNNVYVNSINHNFDAREFIDAMPLDRVVQLHIAGHKRHKKLIVDTHGEDVIKPVYELMEYVLAKTEVKAVMLERDQNYPDFEKIVGELKTIRTIMQKQQPELIIDRQKNIKGPQYASTKS